MTNKTTGQHFNAKENNPKAKLTNKVVVFIKERLTAGDTCSALARQFHVSASAISRIKTGKLWRGNDG
jgi:LysM repeat protein